MLEIYIVVGLIISAGLYLRDLIFNKKEKFVPVSMMAYVLGNILTFAFFAIGWPFFIKDLLFPKSIN